MPLISNCTFANPQGAQIPAEPAPTAAPPLAPMQGDHVFGDVVGVVRNALSDIFGGGAVWPTRMANYSGMLAEVWNGLSSIDLGHANTGAPVVTRTGLPEQDQHAHMFGGYASRLRWHLAEVVCAGHAHGGEERRIGGVTTRWRGEVLHALDDVLRHLVDETALLAYIRAPNATRQAAPGTIVHRAIPLDEAITLAGRTAGPGQAQVQAILNRYQSLPGLLDGLMRRFEGPVKRLDPNTNGWTVLPTS
ncbi:MULTISPECIES: hypothetical protein [Nitrospirillum]|uniref:Uncharacterized protein n=1 Tax=Nitrospirillum amazonense TaxID=28077 RepID=A0A560FKX5_9PROT|nr:hypothetical protein [Nitrospirillum amazonense]MEC4590881.1 hypothetical protein [Nitrospirillum amazonense]TWB22263.1 hypothetical protein FBZ88_11694 [Nitrospirillum amazonense]